MRDALSSAGANLAAKEEKGLTFEQISKKIGLAETLVAALFYGQFVVGEEMAKKLVTDDR